MFEIKNTLGFNADKLVSGNEYDYVTRTSLNQGILHTTGFVNQENLNDSGIWSLGLLQMDFFYRRKPWYAGQFVRKIIPKFKLSENTILYFSTLLNMQKKKLLSVLVRNVDATFRNLFLSLPITSSGEIDFDFMESFIRELEEERIRELNAYLQTTGLKNYALTVAEQKVLEEFEHVKWGKFRLGDLFEKIKVNSLKYKTSTLPNIAEKEYDLPALTAGIQNQGLNNYVPRENATVLKNVISISANGANTGATFYQSKEFTVLQDAYAIRWMYSDKILTDDQSLFLVSAISKSIYGSYEWTNKAGWERIKNDTIQLPLTPTGEIDFDFMETFIKAIEKLVIKDVVQYTDKRIAATEQMVK